MLKVAPSAIPKPPMHCFSSHCTFAPLIHARSLLSLESDSVLKENGFTFTNYISTIGHAEAFTHWYRLPDIVSEKTFWPPK